MIEAKRILDFLALSERLKLELRHSWLSDGRQESVAEHSWHMALIALLVHRHLDQPVDLERTLKMVIVHDLVEITAGDVPFFETGERKRLKSERERRAIDEIRHRVAGEAGSEIHDLWHEFEDGATREARFAKALDNLEVQVQHNLADIETWEPIEYDLVYTKMDKHCGHDAFLSALCEAVKAQAEEKMANAGIDVGAVKQRLGNV